VSQPKIAKKFTEIFVLPDAAASEKVKYEVRKCFYFYFKSE